MVFTTFFIIFCSHFSGLDKIEFLQSHENIEIYKKAFEIIERFFGSEEEDSKVAPSVQQTGSDSQYVFNTDQNVPMGGFNL